jgi:hypothetical protein
LGGQAFLRPVAVKRMMRNDDPAPTPLIPEPFRQCKTLVRFFVECEERLHVLEAWQDAIKRASIIELRKFRSDVLLEHLAGHLTYAEAVQVDARIDRQMCPHRYE